MEKQQTAGWGDAVVEQLAADLRGEFPDMRGFSVSNVWRMKQFFLAHSSPEFLAQAARELKKPHGQFMPQPVAEIGHETIPAQAVRELAASIPCV